MLLEIFQPLLITVIICTTIFLSIITINSTLKKKDHNTKVIEYIRTMIKSDYSGEFNHEELGVLISLIQSNNSDDDDDESKKQGFVGFLQPKECKKDKHDDECGEESESN